MKEVGPEMAAADVVPIGRRTPREPEPLLRDVLGELLRRERNLQGRTLSDVAQAAQVSKPYLSEVERGRKEPSSEILSAICASLGIALVDLVGRTHEELTVPAGPRPSVAEPRPSARGTGPALLLVA